MPLKERAGQAEIQRNRNRDTETQIKREKERSIIAPGDEVY